MSDEPLSKHTLFLREGDFDYLKQRFPSTGASLVVRRIVSIYVDKIRQPLSKKQLADLQKEVELEK